MGVAARENMSVGWAGRKIVRLECAYIMKGGRVFFLRVVRLREEWVVAHVSWWGEIDKDFGTYHCPRYAW